MKNRYLIFIFLILLAYGCSKELAIGFINNTGANIYIDLDNKPIEVKNTERIEFKYPSAKNMIREVTIRMGSCQYKYIFPYVLDMEYFNLNGYEGVLEVQIENEGIIYLVPPKTKLPVVTSSIEDIQQNDFPLKPVSKSCF